MKRLTVLIILVFGLSVLHTTAQDNVFLSRTYWKENPSIDAVETSIDDGNDPAALNAFGFDGVVYAILEEVNNETIKHLIEKPGNAVNKLTHDGRTYLFWAAYKGNTDLMEYLLEKGAKTNIIDDHGNTILNFAASTGQTNTMVYDICLANGANLKEDLNDDGANALLLIAPYDDENFKLINYFTSKGLDITSTDANGNGIFNYVAKTGNIPLMNNLLKKGLKGNNTAFIFAAQGTRGKVNDLAVFKYLEGLQLNPNVTTSKDRINPLHILSARSSDREIISYFINNGINPNKADANGNTPLLNAARSNTLPIITLLSEYTDNINVVNNKGESALALALQNNSAESVLFLIENNTDVNAIDTNGNNMAYYLINGYESEDVSVFENKLKALKASDFVITTPQKNGNTLWHLALEKNDFNLIKYVPQFNVDINAKNNDGITPLHLAAMKADNIEILKYLRSLGAKKETLTAFDETAYDLALENELLKQQNIAVDFLK